MKINDLVYFKFLAEGNSFTKTAEHFFVSQPSISIALQRLEEEFGTKLITRTRSSKIFSLTTTGKILYNNTKLILNTLENTKREINDFEAEKARLGYTPTLSAPFLPPILENIGEFKDKMDLVENDNSDEMLEMLNQEYVSIAILSSVEDAITNPDLETYKLQTKPMQILVSKDHELASKSSIEASDLIDYNFVVLEEDFADDSAFKQWTLENDMEESSVMTSKDIQTVLAFISSGSAISFMPNYFAETNDNIVAIPVDNAPEIHVFLVVNKAAETSNLQSNFNQKIVEILTGEN